MVLNCCPCYYVELMRDDRLLYEWIVALEETGFVLLRNVPQQPQQIHALAERVGVLRVSQYGWVQPSDVTSEWATRVRM